MPTANRTKFISSSIAYFLNQDYPNRELIIVDDGKESVWKLIPNDPRIHYSYHEPMGTLGIKRNIACDKAAGEIIMHWDDDDFYASDWITVSVYSLLKSGADLVGLNKILFHSLSTNEKYLYEDSEVEHPWICGSTMAYYKSFWQVHPFADLQIGEDYSFLWNTNAKIHAVDYLYGFVSILHSHNTSLKPIEIPHR